MTYNDIKNLVGEFTWDFGQRFLIKTEKGFFEWRDPDYGGDNTIRRFEYKKNPYKEFFRDGYGRDKGNHYLDNYCGNDCKFVE